jgi:hypothetical protein
MSDPSSKLALRIHDEVGLERILSPTPPSTNMPVVQWKRRLLLGYLHVQTVPHLWHRRGRQGGPEWRQRCRDLLPQGRQGPRRSHKGRFYSGPSILLLHLKLETHATIVPYVEAPVVLPNPLIDCALGGHLTEICSRVQRP